jgi:O-antigen/teichoic acid export membrane protein
MTQEGSVFFRFALPAALSGFSFMPAMWLSNTFLARQPGGYLQLALYAAAANLRTFVLLLPQLFNYVGMSLLNNARGTGDEKRYRQVFWGNLLATAAVTLTGATGLAFFGPTLLAFFGRSFGDGYRVLLVLLASTILEALMLAVYQIIQSQGRMWISLFAVALPRDVMIVLLAYLLTPEYGAVGMALAFTSGSGLALISTILAVILLKGRNTILREQRL